jgi:hypothetical protein
MQHYIVTPPMVAVFARIIEGLRPGSGHRAWRITGDYGTGKSSFALVLAHLLGEPSSPSLALIHRVIAHEVERTGVDLTAIRLVPVLVTGAREPLVPAIARAVGRALEQLRSLGRTSQSMKELQATAAAIEQSGDAVDLLELLDQLGRFASHHGRSGVLLVLDELGKFLEYAALHPDEEDIYVLQRIAEAAARSGETRLVVVGLLHQGFHAYAERLPSAARQEWDKVAGRYGEITFDQPLAHVAALVAGALNVDTASVPSDVSAAAEVVRTGTLATGWYGASGGGPDPHTLYPLHPMVLPVLVRFFAQFGQHERSLFSFLLSSEPFGLQSFAEREASGRVWYRLADFYDYVRAVFGHRLAGASYRSHWLRILGTIDRIAADLDVLELQVLKSVAVLNVLDAEHLLATDSVLAAATADSDRGDAVREALTSLQRRGLLFHRGTAGGFCLWPSTSVNLEAAFEVAQRALGPVDRVASQLKPYLDAKAVMARRHYIETGTLRHFEVRHAQPPALPEVVAQPSHADGVVIVALCESPEERRVAVEYAQDSEVVSRGEVLLVIPPPVRDVAAELQDARCWQWIADNTPELVHDTYAAAEVARQTAASGRALLKRLEAFFGFRLERTSVEWWHCGKQIKPPARGGLPAALSTICDALYPQAPSIRNELVNRRTLSSAAAAARQRLIEHMFSSSDRMALGIDPAKAPPEKSMYLSVLHAGNVHREEAGRYVLVEPPENNDPLLLRPALMHIMALLEQVDGRRLPVPSILDALQERPYGVRAGLAPLLLAIVTVAHAHEIAVYEHGTFLPRCGAAEFLRLMKQPATFELQLCRIIGVRAEVFLRLAWVFGGERPRDRELALLDVVRPLSAFAAHLPEYTRRSACGLPPFPVDEPGDGQRAQRYVDALREAMDALRASYPQLLERLRRRVAEGLAAGGAVPDRAQVTYRASRLMAAAREPRLQTFARCLADAALSDDAWAERVGSFVISKPPARWTGTDEFRAMDDIELLAATFCRVEATAFNGIVDEPDLSAIRLGLTQGNGTEEALIVRTHLKDESKVQALAARLEAILADSGELRLAALARVLSSSITVTRRSP